MRALENRQDTSSKEYAMRINAVPNIIPLMIFFDEFDELYPFERNIDKIQITI